MSDLRVGLFSPASFGELASAYENHSYSGIFWRILRIIIAFSCLLASVPDCN